MAGSTANAQNSPTTANGSNTGTGSTSPNYGQLFGTALTTGLDINNALSTGAAAQATQGQANQSLSNANTGLNAAASLFATLGNQGSINENTYNSNLGPLLQMYLNSVGISNPNLLQSGSTLGGYNPSTAGTANGLAGNAGGVTKAGGPTGAVNRAAGGAQAASAANPNGAQVPSNTAQYNPYNLQPAQQEQLNQLQARNAQAQQSIQSQYASTLNSAGIQEGSPEYAAGMASIQEQFALQNQQVYSTFIQNVQTQQTAALASVIGNLLNVGSQGTTQDQEAGQGLLGTANTQTGLYATQLGQANTLAAESQASANSAATGAGNLFNQISNALPGQNGSNSGQVSDDESESAP